jgi:hypothetical protein
MTSLSRRFWTFLAALGALAVAGGLTRAAQTQGGGAPAAVPYP